MISIIKRIICYMALVAFCQTLLETHDHYAFEFLLACTPVVTDTKLAVHKEDLTSNAGGTKGATIPSTADGSFSSKFEQLKNNAVNSKAEGPSVTANILNTDAQTTISGKGRIENPLNKRFKISTSFANDQSVSNASANVNMFVRLHNKFFSINFVPFNLFERSSFTAKFTHLVDA